MEQPAELEYARPAVSSGSKVWAGLAILLGGIALAVVGGCFLIGVMLTTNHGFNTLNANAPLSTSATFLVFVLYLLAGISFAAAALIIIAGLRALLRIARA